MKHQRPLYGMDCLRGVYVDWSLSDLKISTLVMDVNRVPETPS
jgi:hypothetical protein